MMYILMIKGLVRKKYHNRVVMAGIAKLASGV